MRRAIELASQASSAGDVPVGAVIVRDGEIVSEGRNRREELKNSLYHAEMIAINEACLKLKKWRLDDCDLYVTLEPCAMCAGAILNSRIRRLFFGAYNANDGACDSVIRLFNSGFDNAPDVIGGMMELECIELLQSFFNSLRSHRT